MLLCALVTLALLFLSPTTLLILFGHLVFV